MIRLIIVGTGGMGREAAWIVDEINASLSAPRYEIVGFVTNQISEHGCVMLGRTVLGDESAAAPYLPEVRILLGVGEPKGRAKLAERFRAMGATFETIVHPAAAGFGGVPCGEGCIVSANATVTTNVRIGEHCIVNVNASISHDGVLGNFVTLAPGVHLTGNVYVDDGVEFGVGAVVLPGKKIGAWAMVGAGAVVTKDVAAGVTVMGVPAREQDSTR